MPWREHLKSQHAQRVGEGLWRQRSVLASPQGREVMVEGRPYLNFCSNDYLGLANHPKLAAAASDAVESFGTGSGASHLVCGHSTEHDRLEQSLALLVGAEKAVVFSTGYMANLAIPQTFLARNDLILEDRLNHASLIDAGRYCDATMKRYPHLDLEALNKQLAGSDAPRKMVMTDGVFSMDGDVAPVKRLQEICDRHKAVLVVDDAHGFGVLGECGAGTLESAGMQPRENVLMVGTFGKAVGSFGAFVAGDTCYIESLIQFARTYIYTTALPPAVVAATLAAIEIFGSEPERREALHGNIEHFRNTISGSGLRLMESQTPIQPIVTGSSESALRASQLLKENGIWVAAIRPPTVPVGSARLRVTLTAEHRREDIDRIAEILGSDPMKRIFEESK